MGATALAQERLFALRKAIAKIEGRAPGDALAPSPAAAQEQRRADRRPCGTR